MATNFDPREYAQAYMDSAASGDFERLKEYWSDDIEFKDPTSPEKQRGRDAFLTDQRRWLDAMSDMRLDIQKIVSSGNEHAYYMRIHGRHTGALELEPGVSVPPTNRELDLEYADFVTVDDSGKVKRDFSVFDLVTMMQQLGISPEQMTAGTQGRR